jgi:hypothetical protein
MTTPAASAGGTSDRGTSDRGVEKIRAWTGLYAVIAGDIAIALAAILGITHFANSGTVNSQVLPQVVAILSSAFTAIGTMTTAYFGIKSMANTANNIAGPPTGTATPGPGPVEPAPGEPAPDQPAAQHARVVEKQAGLRIRAERIKWNLVQSLKG